MQLDYIAFGAHGPREPLTKPGHAMKVLGGVAGVLAASGALFYAIRVNGKYYTMPILQFSGGVSRQIYLKRGGCAGGRKFFLTFFVSNVGQETPHTISKEWEEKTNEYLKSQNSNPISGISSEGYKGTGYVVSK